MKKILILSAVIGIIGVGPTAMAENSGGAGSSAIDEGASERQMNREPGISTGSVHAFDTYQQVNRGMKRDRDQMLPESRDQMIPERGAPDAEEAAPVGPR